MNTLARFVICVVVAAVVSPAVAAEKAAKMMSHDVFFTLKDDSPKAREALVVGCKKFLSEHSGVVSFAAGAIVEEHDREVNDRGFDVALHMVFKDKASHDKYQEADLHHKFIAEFEANWESVRVFDFWVTLFSHGPTDQDAKEPAKSIKDLRLPDAAAQFSGMIEAVVAMKTDRGVVVEVEEVVEVWRGSKAKDPNSLAGKKVHVVVAADGRYGQLVRKFVQGLKAGERVVLDVAHREGEVLVVLELTEKQRQRVAD